jgi:hypothetical protein
MNNQQGYAVVIQTVLVLAMLAAMAAPAARFGFVVGTIGKGSVVGIFALLSACWLVYAQRYRPDAP